MEPESERSGDQRSAAKLNQKPKNELQNIYILQPQNKSWTIKKTQQYINPFNEENFNTVFTEWYVPLCRYALKLVNDKAVAEDIVQESLAETWLTR